MINDHLKSRLDKFLTEHEKSYLYDTPCKLCSRHMNLEELDPASSVDFSSSNCIDKIINMNMNNVDMTRRIHIIGNHWPFINKLRHRKFFFYSKRKENPGRLPISYNSKNKRSDFLCITDTDEPFKKLENKFIITQSYNYSLIKNYKKYAYLANLDYLLIHPSQKYKNEIVSNLGSLEELPSLSLYKSYIIIDIKNDLKYYGN
jgi:hypothetical protein